MAGSQKIRVPFRSLRQKRKTKTKILKNGKMARKMNMKENRRRNTDTITKTKIWNTKKIENCQSKMTKTQWFWQNKKKPKKMLWNGTENKIYQNRIQKIISSIESFRGACIPAVEGIASFLSVLLSFVRDEGEMFPLRNVCVRHSAEGRESAFEDLFGQTVTIP